MSLEGEPLHQDDEPPEEDEERRRRLRHDEMVNVIREATRASLEEVERAQQNKMLGGMMQAAPEEFRMPALHRVMHVMYVVDPVIRTILHLIGTAAFVAIAAKMWLRS